MNNTLDILVAIFTVIVVIGYILVPILLAVLLYLKNKEDKIAREVLEIIAVQILQGEQAIPSGTPRIGYVGLTTARALFGFRILKIDRGDLSGGWFLIYKVRGKSIQSSQVFQKDNLPFVNILASRGFRERSVILN